MKFMKDCFVIGFGFAVGRLGYEVGSACFAKVMSKMTRSLAKEADKLNEEITNRKASAQKLKDMELAIQILEICDTEGITIKEAADKIGVSEFKAARVVKKYEEATNDK